MGLQKTSKAEGTNSWVSFQESFPKSPYITRLLRELSLLHTGSHTTMHTSGATCHNQEATFGATNPKTSAPPQKLAMFGTSAKTTTGQPSTPLVTPARITGWCSCCLNSISQMVWSNLNYAQYTDGKGILGEVVFIFLGAAIQITLFKDGGFGTAHQHAMYIRDLVLLKKLLTAFQCGPFPPSWNSFLLISMITLFPSPHPDQLHFINLPPVFNFFWPAP